MFEDARSFWRHRGGLVEKNVKRRTCFGGDFVLTPMKIPPRELAFDIDGVVADTFRIFVERARTIYGFNFRYEDITEYDFRSVIDIEESASREIISSILNYPLEVGIKPIKGAVEVLTELARFGPLLFVTARADREPIMQWVLQHLLTVDKEMILVEATGVHDEKLPILLRYDVRYFVEDCLDTCHLLDQAAIIPLVFDQPWNRKPHPYRTVRNWEEISALIDW
jgi:uncharacterized protein